MPSGNSPAAPKIAVIIPAHDEQAFLGRCLESLTQQTLKPQKLLIVDDNSSDLTTSIAQHFAAEHSYISLLRVRSHEHHLPGSKVVSAFLKGLESLDEDWDILCKFDADLLFPPDYLQQIAVHFQSDPTVGMAGGFCYIRQGDQWKLESLTGPDHIRGALKAYRKQCYRDIGGLRPSMGWDTVDELLAQYRGWKVHTDPALQVKHLRPTGETYGKASKLKQGEAFYKMRYGLLITLIASLKLAWKKGKPGLIFDYFRGYLGARAARMPFIVNEAEGAFIRKLRYKKMLGKLF